MESLVDKVSIELAERLSVESETKAAMKNFETQAENAMNRVMETTSLANKVETEIVSTRDLVHMIKSKNEEMQNTFEQIDRLETIVNQVRDTYNSVAKNLDKMEKTVLASMSKLGKNVDTTVQPYFPPPEQSEPLFNTSKPTLRVFPIMKQAKNDIQERLNEQVRIKRDLLKLGLETESSRNSQLNTTNNGTLNVFKFRQDDVALGEEEELDEHLMRLIPVGTLSIFEDLESAKKPLLSLDALEYKEKRRKLDDNMSGDTRIEILDLSSKIKTATTLLPLITSVSRVKATTPTIEPAAANKLSFLEPSIAPKPITSPETAPVVSPRVPSVSPTPRATPTTPQAVATSTQEKASSVAPAPARVPPVENSGESSVTHLSREPPIAPPVTSAAPSINLVAHVPPLDSSKPIYPATMVPIFATRGQARECDMVVEQIRESRLEASLGFRKSVDILGCALAEYDNGCQDFSRLSTKLKFMHEFLDSLRNMDRTIVIVTNGLNEESLVYSLAYEKLGLTCTRIGNVLDEAWNGEYGVFVKTRKRRDQVRSVIGLFQRTADLIVCMSMTIDSHLDIFSAIKSVKKENLRVVWLITAGSFEERVFRFMQEKKIPFSECEEVVKELLCKENQWPEQKENQNRAIAFAVASWLQNTDTKDYQFDPSDFSAVDPSASNANPMEIDFEPQDKQVEQHTTRVSAAMLEYLSQTIFPVNFVETSKPSGNAEKKLCKKETGILMKN